VATYLAIVANAAATCHDNTIDIMFDSLADCLKLSHYARQE
jgi:hypothetical protein